MFQINDDLSIYATRGDIVFFTVTAEDEGENYKFKPGDVVRIKVFGKKNAEDVVLQKDFPVFEATESVEIYLTKEDTKIGEVISKNKDYWYEVVLNDDTDPQTIIGYDEDGAKVFKLFPEGDDIQPYVPNPRDIRMMDDELDMTSARPVENRAVAREIARLNASVKDNTENIATDKARLDNLISHKVASLSQSLEYMEYITESTQAKIGGSIVSDGVFATITVNVREANLLLGGTGMDYFIIPAECRPIDVGVIHTEDGVVYSINYDAANNRYVLNLTAQSDVTYAPSGAGTVTMSYMLGAYELNDIRVGADGTIYPTAGEAVRKQIAEMKGITPQMFGAMGNGKTDDSKAIQKMFDEAENGSAIFFPKGTYLLDTFATKKEGVYGRYGAVLSKKENITITFEKGAVIKSLANSNNTDAAALFGIDKCTGVRVVGGEFVGELDAHTFESETDTTTFNQSGIWVNSSSNVVLDGLTAHNFIAGCIYIGGNPHSDTVEVRNCLAYHSHYHAIVVEGADNVQIINTEAYDANTNRGFGTSIDVEGISTENVNTNITIDGCRFGVAEASALNINKCKDVCVRNTKIDGSKLTIQTSENVFVSGCFLDEAKLHILQGGSKNIVFDGNKMVNGNITVQIYSTDTRTMEGIVIRNNTIMFDSAFEEETYGIAFFNIQAQSMADVSFVDNVCRCSNGRIMLVKATGGSGSHLAVFSGNKFFVGSDGDKVSQIYRDLISLSKLRADFTGNEIAVHLADNVETASGTSKSTALHLFGCIPNGADCYRFCNNDISIFGDATGSLTALNLLYTYSELTEAPNTRYLDFIGNKICSDVPNTFGLIVPANYKTRVYNNIVTSGLSALIKETQTGVTAHGNIYDTVV